MRQTATRDHLLATGLRLLHAQGFHASGGARGVGEATAKAVVASIVAIFAADYVMTSLLTDI